MKFFEWGMSLKLERIEPTKSNIVADITQGTGEEMVEDSLTNKRKLNASLATGQGSECDLKENQETKY